MANQQGDLVMMPAMDTNELTLTILSYTQHLTTMAKVAQETFNEKAWSLF